MRSGYITSGGAFAVKAGKHKVCGLVSTVEVTRGAVRRNGVVKVVILIASPRALGPLPVGRPPLFPAHHLVAICTLPQNTDCIQWHVGDIQSAYTHEYTMSQ